MKNYLMKVLIFVSFIMICLVVGVKKLFGLDIDEVLVSAESVNIGKSIYADKHGWKSGIMHLGYLLINPFGAIHDLFLLFW